MDIISESFTNSYDLKSLLDIAAKKWNLVTENEIEVESSNYIAPGGLIFEKDTEMLVPIQKISCKVKLNKQGITSILLIHNSEERTILCQAYKDKKPLIEYQYFASADENGREIKNFTDLLIYS